jgi:hypothetical protein
MNKKLLLFVLVFSLVLTGCQQTPEEETDENTENNGAISVQPIENDSMSSESEEETEAEEVEDNTDNTPVVVMPEEPKPDPRLCETDKDCVAISHPDNTCFKGFFNKNSYEAMEDWRQNEDVSAEECSEFGNPVCLNNRCTAAK